MVQIFAIW